MQFVSDKGFKLAIPEKDPRFRFMTPTFEPDVCKSPHLCWNTSVGWMPVQKALAHQQEITEAAYTYWSLEAYRLSKEPYYVAHGDSGHCFRYALEWAKWGGLIDE